MFFLNITVKFSKKSAYFIGVSGVYLDNNVASLDIDTFKWRIIKLIPKSNSFFQH